MNIIADNLLVIEYFHDYHVGASKDIFELTMEIKNKYLSIPDIYHNFDNHIAPMLHEIDNMEIKNQDDLEMQFVKYFFAVFHDITPYIPSARSLLNNYVNMNSGKFARLFNMVHEAIDATRYAFGSFEELSSHCLACVQMDVKHLNCTDIEEITYHERLIFNEYSQIDYPGFVEERLMALQKIYNICDMDPVAMNLRFDIIKNFEPRIAVFAGSFNPFHVGHMNVLKQAEKNFDKVIIAIGINTDKSKAKCNIADLREKLPRHQIEAYSTLLSDFINSKTYPLTLVRGLRNGQDLQYEQNIRSTIKDLDPDINIVYYLCDSDVEHVSSSMVRDVHSYNPNAASKYLI